MFENRWMIEVSTNFVRTKAKAFKLLCQSTILSYIFTFTHFYDNGKRMSDCSHNSLLELCNFYFFAIKMAMQRKIREVCKQNRKLCKQNRKFCEIAS
jgi:hypothetical protein